VDVSQPFRPIGYWLKHLDGLIEASFEQVLADERLDRRQWQVLNSLHDAPANRAELDTALAPFLASDPDGVHRALIELRRRGWVAQADSRFALTADGSGAFEGVSAKVSATRQRVRAGVTDAEYLATVGVLERMAANLQS
jgi:hypothetical protein